MTTKLLEMQMSWGETLKTSGVGFLIVLCVLAVIAVLILFISKGFAAVTGKSSKETKADEVKATPAPVVAVPVAAPAPVAAAPVQTVAPGWVRLENISEPTAATVMAIVSHQTGIPLNRLAFSSIKLIREELVLEDVDDQSAAIIMAIVSDKTGIPLNRLEFKSIKLIKEN